MAAGLGFKTFTTGEVLTAGDVNGYLMQGVLVFASAAARNSAITSPQEGQFAYTKDTNSLWYYDGAAWVASGATGDIEGVTATSPLTGGGTSGTVTVGIQDASTAQRGSVQLSDSTSTTSSVLAATPTAVKSAYDLANGAIPKTLTTTTGDTIYASSANTPARLGIGSTGQVLTVTGGVPVWATPSAGGASFVGCFLTKSTSQAISNGSNTAVTFNQESFDTSGFHDNSTNNSRITIPSGKAGKYLLTFQTNMDGSSAGGREANFTKNGTGIGYYAPGSGGTIAITGFWSPNISQVVDAAVSDYFEVKLYQSSGSSKNIQGEDWSPGSTFFSAIYLGA